MNKNYWILNPPKMRLVLQASIFFLAIPIAKGYFQARLRNKDHREMLLMKAVTFQGVKNVHVKNVKDPKIKKADDIIVKLTTTAICGSDLHLLHGMIPNLGEDYVIGHEP